MGLQRVGHDLVTEKQQYYNTMKICDVVNSALKKLYSL